NTTSSYIYTLSLHDALPIYFVDLPFPHDAKGEVSKKPKPLERERSGRYDNYYFFSAAPRISSTSFITGFIASRWLSVSKYLTPSRRRLFASTSSLGMSVLRESGPPSSAWANAF